MNSFEDFLKAAKAIAEEFNRRRETRILLLHHNDCDGLTSAAILLKVLERAGIKYSSYALEKPYPKVLQYLFSNLGGENQDTVVMTDFASGMLPVLKTLNPKQVPIFVLDHHAIIGTPPLAIKLLNPLHLGMSGPHSMSSSVVSYYFAKVFGEAIDDLSGIASLGAIGDGMFSPNGLLTGGNNAAFEEACRAGLAGYEKEYWILSDGRKGAAELVRFIDALGSFAYFESGPDIAIKGLQQGFSEPFTLTAQKYLAKFESDYSKFKTKLNLREGSHIAHFEMEDFFPNYGVKTVGLVCSRLISEGLAPGDKYLAGFQRVPNQIPGLGAVELNESKVSMRVPPSLLSKIESNLYPAISLLLPEATLKVGGFSDACHQHAGASTLPINKKSDLIHEMEGIVAEAIRA